MSEPKLTDRGLLARLRKSSVVDAHNLLLKTFAGAACPEDLAWTCAQAASRFNAEPKHADLRADKTRKELLRLFAAELAVVMLERVKAEERVTQLVAALKRGPTTKDLPTAAAAERYFAHCLVRALCITTPAKHMSIDQAQMAADAVRRLEDNPAWLQRLLVPLAVMAAMGSDTTSVASEQVDVARYVAARCIKTDPGRSQPDPALSDKALSLAKHIVEVVFDKLERRTMRVNAASSCMHPVSGAARDWVTGKPDDGSESRARAIRNEAVANAQWQLCRSPSGGPGSPQSLTALPTTSSGQGVAVVGKRAAAVLGDKSVSQLMMATALAAPCPPSFKTITNSMVSQFACPGLGAALDPEVLPHLDECFGICVLSLDGAKEVRANFLASRKGLSTKEQESAIDPVAGTWAEELVTLAAGTGGGDTKLVAFKQAQATAAALGIVAGIAVGSVDMRVSIAQAALVAAPALRAAAAVSSSTGASAAAGATTAALRQILVKAGAFVVEPNGDFARLVGLKATASTAGKRCLNTPRVPLPARGFSSLSRAADMGRVVGILSCQLAAALESEPVAPVVPLSAVNRLLGSPISWHHLEREYHGVLGVGASEADAMSAAGWVSTGAGKWRARNDTDEVPLTPQEQVEAAATAAEANAKAAKAAAQKTGTTQSKPAAEATAATEATKNMEEEEEEYDAIDDDEDDDDAGVFLALCPDGCTEFSRRRVQAHAAKTLTAANSGFAREGGTVARERILALPELSFAAIAELIVSSAGPTALGLAVLGRGTVAALPDGVAAAKLAAAAGLAEPAAMQALVTPATPGGFTVTSTGLMRKSSPLEWPSDASRQALAGLESQLGLGLPVPSHNADEALDDPDVTVATGAFASAAAGAGAGADEIKAATQAVGGCIAMFKSLAVEVGKLDAGFGLGQTGESWDGVGSDVVLANASSVWTARPRLRVLKRLAPAVEADSRLFLARPPALRLRGIAPMVVAAPSLCAASTAADVDVGQVIVEASIGTGGSAVPGVEGRRLVEACLDATAAMLMVPPAPPGSIGLRWTLVSGDGTAASGKAELFALSRAKQESCAFVKGRLQKVNLSERATVAMAVSTTGVSDGANKSAAEPARHCSPAGPCCPS